jgi:hypothetical protein
MFLSAHAGGRITIRGPPRVVKLAAAALRRCNIDAAMLDPIHPVQVEGFRRMSPADKLHMVCALYEAGIRLRVAGLRMTHPEWSDERLAREARRSLLHAGT